MKQRVHVIISGRVQGVCYRYWTQQKARELGLTGWVRNRYDGSVEAEFCGKKAQVDEMLRMCRTGPGSAFVENTRINILSEPVEYTGFSILPTR